MLNKIGMPAQEKFSDSSASSIDKHIFFRRPMTIFPSTPQEYKLDVSDLFKIPNMSINVKHNSLDRITRIPYKNVVDKHLKTHRKAILCWFEFENKNPRNFIITDGYHLSRKFSTINLNLIGPASKIHWFVQKKGVGPFRLFLTSHSSEEGAITGQKCLKSMEKNASATSFNRVADKFFFGKGVDKDKNKASVIYRHAAKLGSSSALGNLSRNYYYGNGVNQDYALAVDYGEKSAQKGHRKAQYILGLCYRNGNGVPKDEENAIHYLTQSANQEYASAQYVLSQIYNEKKLYTLQTLYRKLAAHKGHQQAMKEGGHKSTLKNNKTKATNEIVKTLCNLAIIFEEGK